MVRLPRNPIIPWSMTLCRILFTPAILWLALESYSGWLIALCIAIEVVLDIFDGIVARRLGVVTPALRRMDSIIDTIFYLAILYLAFAQHLDALRQRWWMLAAVLTLEACRYLFDYFKFHREAAYHMWSSKAWGLLLGIAATALLGFGRAGWLLSAALLAGIVSDLEGLAISCLLHKSVEDVPHLFRALKIRREQQAQSRFSVLAARAR